MAQTGTGKKKKTQEYAKHIKSASRRFIYNCKYKNAPPKEQSREVTELFCFENLAHVYPKLGSL
jgi:hypothetical protein